MKKICGSLLSAVVLFGACFFNGNFANATEGSEAEADAAARVAAAVPSVIERDGEEDEAPAAAAVDGEAAEARDTEIVFVVDASTSMRRFSANTIGQFNRVMDEQRREVGVGRAFVTTVIFNRFYTKIHDRQDLQRLGAMTAANYVMHRGTALRDAIGRTIRDLSCENEVADHKVVFIVITDGYDTASREYSKDQIKALIREKKAQGWEFVFYGSNDLNVEDEGDDLGFDAGDSVAYEPSVEGSSIMFENISSRLSSSRLSRQD